MLYLTIAFGTLALCMLFFWFRDRRAGFLLDGALAVSLPAAIAGGACCVEAFLTPARESEIAEVKRMPGVGGGSSQPEDDPGPRQVAASAPNLEKYRTHQVDPRARAVPRGLLQRVAADPEQSLGELVRQLVDDVEDPFQRVKIIHDWVADNIAYDVNAFFQEEVRAETSWQATLRRGASVCSGYAALFEKMCQTAGIPCRTVSGYGRGYSYLQSENADVTSSNHAWNAAQIKGTWYLIDATWDAGHVSNRKFIKDFSHAYLFVAPRQFLFTHFPTQATWQLIDKKVTPAQFCDLPYLKGGFFEWGLHLHDRLSRRTRVGDQTQVLLGVPRGAVISCGLESLTGERSQPRTLIQRDGERCRVLVAFPRQGRWRAEVYAKRRDDPGSFSHVATFDFEASRGTSLTFPQTFQAYTEFSGALLSPRFVPLNPRQKHRFRIRVAGVDNVRLTIGDAWIPLEPQRSEPGVYEVEAYVPDDRPVRLLAKRSADDSSYLTLVDFSVD